MFHLMSTKVKIEGFERPLVEPQELPDPVLVRRATARDDSRIRVLAALDDRRLPEGPFLVAEIGGDLLAAMSLSESAVIADPFRRTADAEDLLRLRAAQIAQRSPVIGVRSQRGSLRPATAA